MSEISNPVTQSAIIALGGVVKLGQQTVPLVLVSSGTMGNNGALSAITAVATTYPSAYCYFPAGAIAAGSAAGWYFCQFSGTTAATVFNNTYTSGTPTIPASPTPFVTTGPGAYTQTTGSNIAAYTLSIPGNTIGLNGSIRVMGVRTNSNTSNNKTLTLNYGAYSVGTSAVGTNFDSPFFGGFSNRGATNVQVPLSSAAMLLTPSATALVYGAIDSTSAQNLVFNLQLNTTATDFIVLESTLVELLPGVA